MPPMRPETETEEAPGAVTEENHPLLSASSTGKRLQVSSRVPPQITRLSIASLQSFRFGTPSGVPTNIPSACWPPWGISGWKGPRARPVEHHAHTASRCAGECCRWVWFLIVSGTLRLDRFLAYLIRKG
jgi:hypothetical protein